MYSKCEAATEKESAVLFHHGDEIEVGLEGKLYGSFEANPDVCSIPLAESRSRKSEVLDSPSPGE